MSNLKKKLLINDFWSDCLKENNTLNISKNNNKSSSLIYFYNKVKRNKRIYKYNTNSLSLKNSKLIKNIINSEKKENKKEKETIEYLKSLYDKGMLSKEKKKRKISEQRITLEKKEINIKPRKYTNKKLEKKIKKNFGNLTIYERGIKYEQKKIEKKAKLFEENNKKYNIMYPFRPNISCKNLNYVFFSDNYFKDQMNNDSNKIFISRLIKGRKEENKKFSYENSLRKNNTNNIINRNYNYKKLKKSLSQKDSIIFQKKLHNTLLNFKFLQIDDKENDNIEDFFHI